MRYFLILILCFVLLSCKETVPPESKPQKTLSFATYRGVLELQDKKELPFIFQVLSSKSIKIYNGKEIIDVTEIEYKNDSVYIKMPVFEGYIVAGFKGKNLEGSFVKEGLNRVVPFTATYNDAIRFKTSKTVTQNVSGIWETVFSKGNNEDEYVAKGIFKQKGKKVAGTFRTTTGDYRFLEGVMDGDSLRLSTFDGAHTFLFVAKVTEDGMKGTFYSGNHWKEPFEAKRNPQYKLPDAESLTYLNDGYDSIDFSFPDAKGNTMSLSNDRFKNKVVVVQVMGTWCPNCLDESKYYADFYKKNKAKGFEVIALAFEYEKDKKAVFKRIDRLATKVEITYPILLAQYGTTSKTKAQEKLPMLNHVLSYPTSIFIDKKGKVRKIHTGFNGPATGEKYTQFTTEFESFVNQLLSEQL